MRKFLFTLFLLTLTASGIGSQLATQSSQVLAAPSPIGDPTGLENIYSISSDLFDAKIGGNHTLIFKAPAGKRVQVLNVILEVMSSENVSQNGIFSVESIAHAGDPIVDSEPTYLEPASGNGTNVPNDGMYSVYKVSPRAWIVGENDEIYIFFGNPIQATKAQLKATIIFRFV